MEGYGVWRALLAHRNHPAMVTVTPQTLISPQLTPSADQVLRVKANPVSAMVGGGEGTHVHSVPSALHSL